MPQWKFADSIGIEMPAMQITDCRQFADSSASQLCWRDRVTKVLLQTNIDLQSERPTSMPDRQTVWQTTDDDAFHYGHTKCTVTTWPPGDRIQQTFAKLFVVLMPNSILVARVRRSNPHSF